MVKNLPALQETWVQSLGWEDPLQKWKAAHSSILAWRIPWSDFHFTLKKIRFKSEFISYCLIHIHYTISITLVSSSEKRVCVSVCVCQLSCVQLFCNPMYCSLSDSSVHGVFQAGLLKWDVSFSRGCSWPRDRTHISYISCTGRQLLHH